MLRFLRKLFWALFHTRLAKRYLKEQVIGRSYFFIFLGIVLNLKGNCSPLKLTLCLRHSLEAIFIPSVTFRKHCAM